MAIQRNYSEATATLDSILSEYPGHSLKDEILMLKGRMAESKYDYELAITFYEQVLADHYFDISADNALYRTAELYEHKLGKPSKAADLYKQLMVDFPGSLFVVEARKRFRNIRGDEPNTETPRIIPEKVP
jgi:outer membrane protein assembly factor BamD (BamD/ComL family)